MRRLNGRSNQLYVRLKSRLGMLTQIESQQRLKGYFNKWLCPMTVSFMKQGVITPIYFAPPQKTLSWSCKLIFSRDFQVTIGTDHAKYFDCQWLVLFHKKKKFSTFYFLVMWQLFPPYNGGIGMTYEQGGMDMPDWNKKTLIGIR